ncbi:MAG TPA: DegT/DnrJ/EryC1/StrS family aminotransferase [Ktedonobacterales bacterium]|nr:DegT/DnrJ/EryC1/StrS family aminotransferase [Ktedonobacterales bacterium]
MTNEPVSNDATDATSYPLIPISRPFIGAEEAQAAADAVRSGWLSAGPRVADFERAVAERVGVAHAVAVSSGTAALHLALLSAGLRPGDEVIVPSFGDIATVNAIFYVGARPVFVDIDARSYDMAPMLIEPLITQRTRAILPVDHLGLPAALAPILGIARRYNLTLIEDASAALGAIYRGKPVGSVSPITCFSFQQDCAITTGEGGMLVTNDERIVAQARMLRDQGLSETGAPTPFRRESELAHDGSYDELGYTYRLTDVQAAIGIAQLDRLDDILARRRAVAARYAELLAGEPGVQTPYAPDHAPHTYQGYCLRLDLRTTPARSLIMERMRGRGIMVRRGGVTVHEEPYYVSRMGRLSLPASEAAMRETLRLPLYAEMTEEEQDRVIAALRDALRAGPRPDFGGGVIGPMRGNYLY